jgi:hypothetical protein
MKSSGFQGSFLAGAAFSSAEAGGMFTKGRHAVSAAKDHPARANFLSIILFPVDAAI